MSTTTMTATIDIYFFSNPTFFCWQHRTKKKRAQKLTCVSANLLELIRNRAIVSHTRYRFEIIIFFFINFFFGFSMWQLYYKIYPERISTTARFNAPTTSVSILFLNSTYFVEFRTRMLQIARLPWCECVCAFVCIYCATAIQQRWMCASRSVSQTIIIIIIMGFHAYACVCVGLYGVCTLKFTV